MLTGGVVVCSLFVSFHIGPGAASRPGRSYLVDFGGRKG